jgi:hypothetical protein
MRSGLLFEKHHKHFGQDSDDVVVIQAESRKLNPTLDQAIIEQALADDPASAAAEWLGQFRDDIAGFIPFTVIETCVDKDCAERPPVPGEKYFAFIDVASGVAPGGDSMTMAIAHLEDLYDDDQPTGRNSAVIDFVREVAPPFQTNAVAAEFSQIMLRYGVREASTDRVGYGWVAEAFRNLGIRLKYSAKTKSEIYLAALPLLGNGGILLLNHQRLKNQILNLEQRVARGGHESVDHPTGNYHDDLANVALGAAVEAHADGGWRPYLVGA